MKFKCGKRPKRSSPRSNTKTQQTNQNQNKAHKKRKRNQIKNTTMWISGCVEEIGNPISKYPAMSIALPCLEVFGEFQETSYS